MSNPQEVVNESLDLASRQAVSQFLSLAHEHFEIVEAVAFGSRAKRTHDPESDLDLAVVLTGTQLRFIEAKLALSDIAYDVLLDTGIRISPLPIRLNEWEHPETFSNPALLENIERHGVHFAQSA